MPTTTAYRVHPHLYAICILASALLVAWLAYAPGKGGTLHFDDASNLDGLRNVADASSAFRFVTAGTAGPSGRPISLASFVPQAYAWPHAPDVFLHTNILIHLLNGLLLAWFLYLLGRARRQHEATSALTAVGTATIWMLMPLLASSSLFIVQRMTTLSAVFTLVGAIAYLYARQLSENSPRTALFWMTIALTAAAMLGILAKENGALLFLFILAVEITLLSRPWGIAPRIWRTWFIVVLVMPLIALLAYLTSSSLYSESVILARQFSGWERLITQLEILWKYLYLGFLPNVPNLGPFHDDYTVQRTIFNATTLISIAGWTLAVYLAVALRRKVPLLSFAIVWYLLGHLLESTTLSLELYFEHRNYLPLVGPVYALVASIAGLSLPWRRIATLCLAAYAAILAGSLFSVSSLWGTPRIAAEMWQIHNPSSKRANVFLAQTLQQEGDLETARRVLEAYLEEDPDAYGVRLYVLGISCSLDPEGDHTAAITALEKGLSRTSFSFFVPNSFESLTRLVVGGHCPGVARRDVYKLGLAILENPRLNQPVVAHNVNVVLSRITLDERDFGATMTHIENALDSLYVPGTIYLAVSILNSGGRYDLSRDLLHRALEREPPKHLLRAIQWRREMVILQAVLDAINKSDPRYDTGIGNTEPPPSGVSSSANNIDHQI